MPLSRRRFLKLTAAAAAGPTLLLPRYAHATEGFGAAKHLLVLFAKGGFRSHCTFNAVGSLQHCPFGSRAASPGTEWTLGGHIASGDWPTSLGTVPGLPAISHDVCVLPAVDHLPGGAAVDVDHVTAVSRIATGAPDGRTGLLSLVGRHHPQFANGFTDQHLPPVEIQPTEFGIGAGDYALTRPLSVVGAQYGFSGENPIGAGYKASARQVFDDTFMAKRSRAFQKRLENFRLAKKNALLFGERLIDPRLRVLTEPAATDAGVTNAQLLEVLGSYTLDALGDTMAILGWGADVALALRFFSLGAPMCVVTRDIYDLHDDEEGNYAARANDLARQLAGLHFLLPRMEHPAGGTYWDHTVVAVVSEFSRNNTMPETGFNSGNGSDHVPEAAGPTRNQAVALLGGPIAARGRSLGETDDDMNAIGQVFSSASLLATFLDVLGIDPAGRLPTTAPAIGELFA